MSTDHEWELALMVRKTKVMEVSNNTGCPTIGCLSNVPQETKIPRKGTASGRTNKDKEEGENRSSKVVTVITAATVHSSTGEV